MTGRLGTRGAALLVFVLALVVQGGSLSFGFLSYDDPRFILEPPVVAAPTAANVVETLMKPVAGSYHPLHTLSYAVDARLWGMERPQGFHATSIGLFAACAALVVLAARSYGCSPRGAALAGVLFAIHPSHVEAVAWLSSRKDVLSAGFVLLALLARRRALLSLGFFACALASKSTAAPIAVFLYVDVAIDRRLDAREALRLAPALALALVWTVLEAGAQRDAGNIPAFGGGPGERFRLVVASLAWYPVRFVWPIPFTVKPALVEDVPRALLVLGCVGAWAIRSRRAAKVVAFFFLGLATVANVVPLPTAVQDRYLFLSSIAAACATGELLARRRALPVAALVAGLFAFGSVRATRAWSSDEALWRQAIAVEPSAPLPHAGLGGALHATGHDDEALAELRLAIALGGGAPARDMMASLLDERGDLAGARAALEEAWRIDASDARRGASLVRVLVRAGAIERARTVARAVEARAPASAASHRARAYVAQASGDLGAASAEYWAAGALDAADWLTVAALERARRRDDLAAVALGRALAADPSLRPRVAADALLAPLLR